MVVAAIFNGESYFFKYPEETLAVLVSFTPSIPT